MVEANPESASNAAKSGEQQVSEAYAAWLPADLRETNASQQAASSVSNAAASQNANGQQSQGNKVSKKQQKRAAAAAQNTLNQQTQLTNQPQRQRKFDRLQNQVDESVRSRWEEEQNRLKLQLEETDRFEWRIDRQNLENSTLRRVAAVDISYSKTDQKKAVAALLIFEFPSMRVIYEDFEKETADYPYIPGFLAFKEIPVYTILFERLKQNKPELYPELLLVDGNGILHTRNFGCASHIGVLFDVPTIGVGKTVFYVDGIRKEDVKTMSAQNLHKGGDTVALVGESGKTWGVALRSTDESSNPVIVSQGHRVSIQTAIDATMACITRFRIPEPIRQADLRSRDLVKMHYDSKKK